MGKTALDGKRLTAFAMDPAELIIVGIDTEHTVGQHPLYDERISLPVDEKLVRNIRHYGVIEPVIVTVDSGRAFVIDGRQRVRAARRANVLAAEAGEEQLLVPVMVRRGEDAEVAGVMVSANEHRRDDDPLTKARKAARLLAMGQTPKQIGVAFGVTSQTIANWLRVLEAAPELRAAVESGQLTATAAGEVAKRPKEEQAAALAELLASSQAPTVRRAKTEREHAEKKTRKSACPSVAMIQRAVLAFDKERASQVDSEFMRALRWVLGEVPTESIPGLLELCK